MDYEFLGEKIVIPSSPVPGINNDQPLTWKEMLKIRSVEPLKPRT